MKEIFGKIKASFKRATNGEELMPALFWWWGVLAYLFAFFVANKLIRAIHFRFVDILIALAMVVYFAWHIYALKKCSPKKPKLTPEEKKKLREERRQQMPKKALRKLLLQEPLTEWDPVFMLMMIDLLCITHFGMYLFK